jgi:hypothetical protein
MAGLSPDETGLHGVHATGRRFGGGFIRSGLGAVHPAGAGATADLPGALGEKLIVEVNGYYWHKCQKVLLPRQRRWQAKDRKRYTYFLSHGYKLMLLWECYVHEQGESATVASLQERLESGV